MGIGLIFSGGFAVCLELPRRRVNRCRCAGFGPGLEFGHVAGRPLSAAGDARSSPASWFWWGEDRSWEIGRTGFGLVGDGERGEKGAVSKSLRNIGVVSGVTMVSRVLGLGRDMAVTAVFGTSAWASAFVTAFTLPNLFRRLLGEGALTAALVPTLQDELAAQRREGAFVVVNQVVSWLLVVTGVLVAGAMVGLHFIAERAAASGAAEGSAAARWAIGARLAVGLFPYLVFVCVAAALSAALQTLGRFLEPALSPVWLNVAMLGALGGAVWGGWAEAEDGRMAWLCAGVLVGGAAQMLVPAWALAREGWRPRWDLRRSEPVRAIARLMGPTVLGSAIYLINLSVSRVIGLSLNEGAAAILNLATRLIELPIGVFAVAVSTVIFPLIAQRAAEGDAVGLAAAYHKGMRLILAINVPAAAGLVVLAEPIVRLLFQRGAFGAGDTAATVPVLAVFALGLPFFAFVNLLLRAFYARKDTRTPVRAAWWSFGVNVGLSLVLMGPLGTLGLAAASNIAVVGQAVFLQRRLSAVQPELGFGPLRGDLVKIVAATAGMAVVLLGGVGWTAGWPGTVGGDVARLGVLVPGGIAVFSGLAWALRIQGVRELAEIGRKRVGRREAQV